MKWYSTKWAYHKERGFASNYFFYEFTFDFTFDFEFTFHEFTYEF